MSDKQKCKQDARWYDIDEERTALCYANSHQVWEIVLFLYLVNLELPFLVQF